MKQILLRSLTVIALVCLAAFYSTNVVAAPAGDLLIRAYSSLEQADHDYKGHRAAAMKQIEEAAKVLHIRVRGDGRAHEKQGVSDEQLRNAEGLLQQAKGGLRGKALKHVNSALKQLHIALSIK